MELLYFDGCPNHLGTKELVERVATEVGVDLDLRLIEVRRPEDAYRMRFLGSPSIRIDGHDVEPGADDREQFEYACRVYRTDAGLAGQPAADWVRAALVKP